MSVALHEVMRHALLVILIACHHPAAKVDDGPPGDVATSDAPVGAKPPNIVLILTDDLDVGVYNQFPTLKALMDDKGAAFHDHFVNVSLCCPSRTAILRGQYAHNTKIFSNGPPNGGFETFFANHSEDETLPVWLSAAGYRTVLMGKYLNGYPNTAPDLYVPPGWTEWYSPVAGDPYGEYNYTLREYNPDVDTAPHDVEHLAAPEDYMVDLLSSKAADFITRAAAGDKPFFMYIAPFSPHAPATPADRYKDDFPDAKAPRTASFNEADMSDKPAWLQSHPLLTDPQIADVDKLYRKRLQSMEGIQDMVQNVIDTLAATNQLDNTYIIFTSDNGFHQGQHRLKSGKNTEFDEDLRVPLAVRGPSVPAGIVRDEQTLNIDFTPTFLDLAGAAIPATVDGRSFVQPAHGVTPPAWRQFVFIEHAADTDDDNQDARPAGIRSTLEPPDQLDVNSQADKSGPPFEGVRTPRYTYAQYSTGELVLYDHTTDPDQLANAAVGATPGLLARLSALVASMHNCTGAGCRSAEEAAP